MGKKYITTPTGKRRPVYGGYTQGPLNSRWDLAAEEWKRLPGEYRVYSISSMGRIRREERVAKHGTGLIRYCRKLLNPTLKKHGLEVELNYKTQAKSFMIKYLVAEAFVPKPEGAKRVIHIDGDNTNCKSGNLEWI